MNSADLEIANSNDYVFRGVKTGDLVIHMSASNAGFHIGSGGTIGTNNTSLLSIGKDVIRIGSESNSHIGISNNILKVVMNGSGGSGGGNGVGVMFIKDSNVGLGVGKSNPIYTVDVAGDLNVSGEIRRNGEVFVGGGGLGGGGWSNKGSNIFVVGSNVGIGISNPTYQLEVTQSAKLGGALTIENGAIYLPNTVTFNGFSINQRESNMGITNLGITPQFNTVGGSNIYLPPGSNLGIGTSNPVGALDVVGDINFSGNLKKNGVIYGGVGGGGGWSNTGSNIFVVGSNVGIGTSNPSGALQVVGNLVMSGDILPNQTLVRNIGASNSRIKNLWVDTIYLGSNTLYIGDTPVLGTNQNTIQIAADPDQGVTMKTSGTGITTVTSTAGVNVNASGLNAQVQVQSTGTGGRVVMGAASEVSVAAPTFTVSGNSVMNGNMTVNGNVTVAGSNFVANVETVEIKDNILVLNKGQTGSGVSAGRAGIAIDRGDALRHELVFEEATQSFRMGPLGATEVIATQTWTSNAYSGVITATSNTAYSAASIARDASNVAYSAASSTVVVNTSNVAYWTSNISVSASNRAFRSLALTGGTLTGDLNVQSIATFSCNVNMEGFLNSTGGINSLGGISGLTVNATSTLMQGGSNIDTIFAPLATSNVAYNASVIAQSASNTAQTAFITAQSASNLAVGASNAASTSSNAAFSGSNRAFRSLALTGGTLTGDLTINSNITVPGTATINRNFFYTFTASVGSNINTVKEFFSSSVGDGGSFWHITMTSSSTNHMGAKHYFIPTTWNTASSSNWRVCPPISSSFNFWAGVNYDLEVNSIGGTTTFRVKRTAGSTVADISLVARGEFISNPFRNPSVSNLTGNSEYIDSNSLPLYSTHTGPNMSIFSGRVGVNTLSPSYDIDINGTINANTLRQGGSNINILYAPLITSNVSYDASNVAYAASNRAFGSLALTGGTLTGTLTGTTINATTLQQGGVGVALSSHNHDASNITTGTLGVARGGTGATSLSANKLVVANTGGTAVATPTGLHWDNANTRLGVNTSSPAQTIDVSGNIRVTGTILEGDSTDTTRAISCLDSAMGVNGNKYICVGKANSSRNQAEISYNHTADGSNGNYMNLGLHSVPILDLYGDASARFRGNLTASLMYLTNGVAFRYSGTTGSVGNGTLIHSSKQYDTQNNYNTSTGEFTVPTKGIYIFSAGIRGFSANRISLNINVNGTTIAVQSNFSGGDERLEVSTHYILNVGDKVTASLAEITSGNATNNGLICYFAGILVQPIL